MRYITIGFALLLVACEEKRVQIPERAAAEAKQDGAIPWVPCPDNVPRICCKDKRACR